MNCHTDTVGTPVEILRVSHEVERDQVRDLAAAAPAATRRPSTRPWPRCWRAARSGENMIPPMLAAARAEATLGEICDALRQEWGVYSEAPAF